jgi:formylglycine-generating enzyme required for sulfatase activity
MHGNVFEWCRDSHELDHYERSVTKDPIGSWGTARVTRGGGWSYPLVYCRSAFRSWLDPYERRKRAGFRVVAVAYVMPTE